MAQWPSFSLSDNELISILSPKETTKKILRQRSLFIFVLYLYLSYLSNGTLHGFSLLDLAEIFDVKVGDFSGLAKI